jgi:DNA repair exonuclease SbcCD nuclease subunit
MIRILLLADTHLGFDLPLNPRVQRRRRGHDFFANYETALSPAWNGEVDIVVHAGDVFDRSRVVPSLAYRAFEPLLRAADRGVPVFIVPGNHERSRIPHLRFASHPGVHVFGSARTFVIDVRGTRLALAGFPYERHDVRERFTELVRQTRWDEEDAALRLLCVHHCFEGATVGPGNYTFTSADDVIRLRDVPQGFAAVLSGHIHRHQVLTTDLSGRSIDVPVLYPGSVERTAMAEIGERKGYMLVHLDCAHGAPPVRWEFRELPARPMIRHELAAEGMTAGTLADAVAGIIAAAPCDAVLSVRVTDLTEEQWQAVAPARLRAMAPATMNVEVTPAGRFAARTRPVPTRAAEAPVQLSLGV